MRKYSTVHEAYPQLLREVLVFGNERESRDYKYIEAEHVSWIVMDMTRLIPWYRSRKLNIFQLIAETLWVLSGEDKIEFLKYYIPSAGKYSDDGEVWRGAYGPRIKHGLQYVIDLLSVDPESRRAYLPIFWNIDTEESLSTKDLPCNVGVQITINGRERPKGYTELVITRFCRSNDLIFGYTINHFEFSVLAQVIFNTLNNRGIFIKKAGRFVNHVSSLHLYNDQIKKAENIVIEAKYSRLHTKEGVNPLANTAPANMDMTYNQLSKLPDMLEILLWYQKMSSEELIDEMPNVRQRFTLYDATSEFMGLCYRLLMNHIMVRKGLDYELAVDEYDNELNTYALVQLKRMISKRSRNAK